MRKAALAFLALTIVATSWSCLFTGPTSGGKASRFEVDREYPTIDDGDVRVFETDSGKKSRESLEPDKFELVMAFQAFLSDFFLKDIDYDMKVALFKALFWDLPADVTDAFYRYVFLGLYLKTGEPLGFKVAAVEHECDQAGCAIEKNFIFQSNIDAKDEKTFRFLGFVETEGLTLNRFFVLNLYRDGTVMPPAFISTESDLAGLRKKALKGDAEDIREYTLSCILDGVYENNEGAKEMLLEALESDEYSAAEVAWFTTYLHFFALAEGELDEAAELLEAAREIAEDEGEEDLLDFIERTADFGLALMEEDL